MIGSRATSGSVATRLRNVVIACSASSRSASMLTSRMFAPPRTCSSATSTAPWKSPASIRRSEPRRAGDVRPLADDDEARVRPDHERLETAEARRAGALPAHAGEPVPRRHPRSPDVCSGVVPQQPPTMLTRPASANSRRKRLVSSGCSSCRPSAFGRPAFGWQATYVDATRASPSRNGRISRRAERAVDPDDERVRRARRRPRTPPTVWPERLRPSGRPP